MTAKVTIETVSESADAQRDLKKLDQSLEDLGTSGKKTGLSLTDLKSGIELAGMALGKIGEAYDATIGKTIAYAEQVRDLGRLSGATTEETSKLIQVADDLKVEYGSLTQAAKALAQDGIALTTEELAKASDEYLAIEDAGGRAEYAVKKFGRAGLELTKVLEAGGDELRNMADAQNKNLVLTQEQVDKARELEIAMDELEDSVAGFTYQLSTGLIPQITSFINVANKLVNIDQKDWFEQTGRAVANYLLKYQYGQKTLDEWEASVKKTNISMTEYQKIADKVAASASRVNTVNKDALTPISDLILALQNEEGAFTDSGSAMKDYNDTLSLSSQKVSDLVTKYGSLTQAMIFNTLAQGMDKDAAIALGVSMGIITPQIMAARDAVDRLAASTSDAMKKTQSYVGQAEALAAAIAKLQDKSITITTYYNNVGQQSSNLVDPNGPGGPGSTPGVRPMTESQLQALEAKRRRDAEIAEERRLALQGVK